MSSFIRNTIMIIGLVALGGLGYYFFVMERGATLDTGDSQIGQGELETQEFLRRLNDLQKIALPTDIFDDPRFTTLKNFGSLLEVVPYGRETPFSLP